MDELINIEPTAAFAPCLLCGNKRVIRAVTIYGCKEHNYDNITFLACDNCLIKIKEEIDEKMRNE